TSWLTSQLDSKAFDFASSANNMAPLKFWTSK
ncbi:unnamed protein product, partial [marine sediment metagenome]